MISTRSSIFIFGKKCKTLTNISLGLYFSVLSCFEILAFDQSYISDQLQWSGISSSALTKKKQKRIANTPKNVIIKKQVLGSKNPSPNVVINPAVMLAKQQRVLNIPNICPFFPSYPNFWHARWIYLPWDTQRGPAESPAMNDPEHDITNLSHPTSVRDAKKPEEQLKVQQIPPKSSCILSGFVMTGAQNVEKMKATQLLARVAGPIPGKSASSQI